MDCKTTQKNIQLDIMIEKRSKSSSYRSTSGKHFQNFGNAVIGLRSGIGTELNDVMKQIKGIYQNILPKDQDTSNSIDVFINILNYWEGPLKEGIVEGQQRTQLFSTLGFQENYCKKPFLNVAFIEIFSVAVLKYASTVLVVDEEYLTRVIGNFLAGYKPQTKNQIKYFDEFKSNNESIDQFKCFTMFAILARYHDFDYSGKRRLLTVCGLSENGTLLVTGKTTKFSTLMRYQILNKIMEMNLEEIRANLTFRNASFLA